MIYEAPNPQTGGTYARWLAFNDSNNVNVGTEWGASTGLAYPTYVGGLLGNGGSAAGIAAYGPFSAGSSLRFAESFNPTRADVALNTILSLNNAVAASNIPRTVTVLNLAQAQRYQAQPSLWFQRVTYYPPYLGPAWVTNKASGAVP